MKTDKLLKEMKRRQPDIEAALIEFVKDQINVAYDRGYEKGHTFGYNEGNDDGYWQGRKIILDNC
jgi:hypothetical protein